MVVKWAGKCNWRCLSQAFAWNEWKKIPLKIMSRPRIPFSCNVFRFHRILNALKVAIRMFPCCWFNALSSFIFHIIFTKCRQFSMFQHFSSPTFDIFCKTYIRWGNMSSISLLRQCVYSRFIFCHFFFCTNTHKYLIYAPNLVFKSAAFF